MRFGKNLGHRVAVLAEKFSRTLFHFDVDAPTEKEFFFVASQRFFGTRSRGISDAISPQTTLSANTLEFSPIFCGNRMRITN